MERTRDSHCLPSNVRDINRYGRLGLMICEDITLDGYTNLHIFERGTMTAVSTHLVDEFLESGDIRLLNRLAKSPDLKNIEHTWDALGRAIATHNSPPRNIQYLKAALLNTGGTHELSYFQNKITV
ncbi:DDE_3 domain-containing protein [Trichonephila clavipes]|nr:DDE_3 domain-containing protein [Trichonephila clavipes]